MTANPTLPRVAVVTVIYRCEKFMRGLLESVALVDYPRERLEFHLVDNGAGDGTLTAARREIERLGGRLPTVVIHEPGANVGFAAGNNMALRAALKRGADYCFLLNPDATFEPAALQEAVRVAESARNVGSVQSLLVLGDEPEVVNSSGNHIHFLGFGYVGGYRRARAEVPSEVSDIAFSSGACVLLPAEVLRQVGLLDETLWLYHEDLDLGWRIRLAGFRNLIAPASVCRHFYEFSRAQSKWYWMERNRWIVVLKNYRLATLLLLLPVLLVADCGLLLMAAKAGWLGGKVRSLAWFLRPSSWRYLWRGRRDIARIRKVPDREILSHFTAVIDFPDFRSPIITKVIEPVWKVMLAVLRTIVRW
ncbi:MAG TPA: glycosyltransferase family 2 protein [Polyangia bacterium]